MKILKKDVLNEIRIDDIKYDGYGTAMSWMFAICDYIEFGLDSERTYRVPFNWGYSPAMGGADSGDPNYQFLSEVNIDYEQLILAGNVLNRYISKLKIAGKDY